MSSLFFRICYMSFQHAIRNVIFRCNFDMSFLYVILKWDITSNCHIKMINLYFRHACCFEMLFWNVGCSTKNVSFRDRCHFDIWLRCVVSTCNFDLRGFWDVILIFYFEMLFQVVVSRFLFRYFISIFYFKMSYLVVVSTYYFKMSDMLFWNVV